ncbi:MAG: chemotaxis protein CheW [Marinilabiliaceae bacterium]|nr:chemotaxis protein CheW [Marinilabiliaceae bacterium]
MSEVKTIISFVANEENFAFDAIKVRHILEFGKQTKIPNTSDYLLGVINLHGNIIPIADFRKLIGQDEPENTKDTSVIVISPDDQISSYIGFVVDMVKEVIQVNDSEIKPSIIDGHLGFIDSFEGTVKINDVFINIINLNDLIIKIEEGK